MECQKLCPHFKKKIHARFEIDMATLFFIYTDEQSIIVEKLRFEKRNCKQVIQMKETGAN